MYFSGQYVAKDYNRAFEYFKSEFDGGYVAATSRLAVCYYGGHVMGLFW